MILKIILICFQGELNHAVCTVSDQGFCRDNDAAGQAASQRAEDPGKAPFRIAVEVFIPAEKDWNGELYAIPGSTGKKGYIFPPGEGVPLFSSIGRIIFHGFSPAGAKWTLHSPTTRPHPSL